MLSRFQIASPIGATPGTRRSSYSHGGRSRLTVSDHLCCDFLGTASESGGAGSCGGCSNAGMIKNDFCRCWLDSPLVEERGWIAGHRLLHQPPQLPLLCSRLLSLPMQLCLVGDQLVLSPLLLHAILRNVLFLPRKLVGSPYIRLLACEQETFSPLFMIGG